MVVDIKDKIQEYNKVGITTSNQEALILKCYDGVIGCIKSAIDSVPNRKEWPRVNKDLIKAQQGLALLADAINKNAGEVATNLLRLYDFMIRSLITANLKKDAVLMGEIMTMMKDLRESWVKAFEKLHAETGDQKTAYPKMPQKNVLNIIG
jgi:flagellar secretion chaperone FliS